MRCLVKKRFFRQPDHRFGSLLVEQFITGVMREGKKETARRIVYGAIEDALKNSGSANPVELLETAVNNVGPSVEVRSRRVGGANYQVPREVRPERRQTLAIRWILGTARARRGSPMRKRLAEELSAAFKGEGEAVKKKENIHKMAEANRAFAHFTW